MKRRRYLEKIVIDNLVLQKLEERGVEIMEIAELVMFSQKRHVADLTIEECEHSVRRVLLKREIQNVLLTGIQLDELTDKKMLNDPLQSIIEDGLNIYGIDEILALGIVNVYGSIAITNFGYFDVLKPEGILKRLDEDQNQCNCFLGDIVAAIAAAAASRIAHNQ